MKNDLSLQVIFVILSVTNVMKMLAEILTTSYKLMKNSILYWILFFLLPACACGQSNDLAILQVPHHTYSTKNGLATSALHGQVIHQSGLVEILDLNQSNIIAGEEVVPIKIDFLYARSSVELIFYKGDVYMLNSGNIISFNHKNRHVDTLFAVENPKNVRAFYLSNDKVAIRYEGDLNNLSEQIQLFTLNGDLLGQTIIPEKEEILYLHENHVLTQTRESNHVKRISLESGKEQRINTNQSGIKQIVPFKGDIFLMYSNDKLFLLDYHTLSIRQVSNEIYGTVILSTLSVAHWKNNLYIIGYGNKLFVFDYEKLQLTYEIRNQRNQLVVGMGSVRELLIDKNQFLYCRTIRNGIYKCDLKSSYSRINNAPENEQFAKNVLVDEDLELIFNTNWQSDLVVHNTKGELIHLIDFDLPENDLLLGIYKISPRVYLLPFEDSKNHRIIRFENQENYTVEKIRSKEKTGSAFFAKELQNDKDHIVIQLQKYLLLYSKKDKNFENRQITSSNYQAHTSFLLRNKVYIQDYEMIKVYNFPDFRLIDSIPVPIQCEIRDYIQENDTTILLAHGHGLLEMNLVNKHIQEISLIQEQVYSLEYFRGLLYLGTNDGVIVLKDREIIDRIASYDALSDSEFNTNAKFKTADALYLGSNSGIIKVTEVNNMAVEYPIQPLRVSVNNKKQLFIFDENKLKKTIVLEPGEQNVEIIFANLSPVFHAQLNYQYAINEGTSDWINLGNKNTLNLNLSPGKYKIFYTGARLFDDSLPKRSFLSIQVKARWYQSTLFKALVLSSIIIGVFLIYLYILKFRNKQILSKLMIEKQVEQEKNRIAMDLHDNIGVNLSMLKRNIDFISENKSDLDASIIDEKLQFLSDVAGEVNTSLRDSIWAAKKEKLTLKEMIDRIEKLVYSLEIEPEKQIVELVNKISNVAIDLKPSKVLIVYRVVQEALHNAIKHSKGSVIKITFEQSNSSVHCIVEDNGIGFDEEQVVNSGLNNMYERAKQEGLKFSLRSTSNLGTTIKITLENEQ